LADGVGSVGGVDNDELLYRRVKPYYKVPADGGFRPSSQAFGEVPRNGVSVDRADLCGHDPSHTQEDGSDYVCSATAGAVRLIETTRKNPTGTTSVYKTDVRASPLPKNQAHADIHESPPYPTDNMYRKLKAKLVQTFDWEDGFAP
jgi:hypothetical protein